MGALKSGLCLLLTFFTLLPAVRACPPSGGANRASYAPRYVAPVPVPMAGPRSRPVAAAVPTPAPAAQRAPALRSEPVYVVCTQDANGKWWLRQTTESRTAALQLKEKFERQGVKAWAMEAIPLPEGRSYSMANGELAIAIAISLGKDAHAVAIGPSGRAEALAKN